MGLRIRRDDTVVVISGKDRGKSGSVLQVDPANERVVVEGVNLVKRHQRPNPMASPGSPAAQGGVIAKEGPIHVSNVMLVDPKTNKPTRVGVTRGEDGRATRVARRSGQPID
ncbi:LSU ribosomal protein L24p (L26e) [Patulibacter medicamentivorans]|jgi:large subunit ribosomal protein L24|uniref:Large ribosomal subunit protein uL24 n=1 Tax=Patulibacter medicamentivorans TaxID=1097667 RepID=H0E8Q1_9ACTN|nr:50S ribosomal protein L24 [Patulibacter medicamentivorans]EHN09929.1 LSU ribosomal protein L24p (L26e) [Patulibacter medicamentivorans]